MPEAEPPFATAPEQNATPATSVAAKMMNVFVSPGEVFDEVKNTPPANVNWLLPLALNIIVGIVFVIVTYSQPSLIQKLRQDAEDPIEKKVQAGKESRKMADQQIALIERIMSPEYMKAMGILGSFFIFPGVLFLTALLVWVVGTFVFRGHIEYMKAVEAAGLASMIDALNKIIGIPLIVIFGNMYMCNLGPALFIKHFDGSNLLHNLLVQLNLVTIWSLVVLSIAMARLSGTKWFKAAFWPFGIWILLVLCALGMVVLKNKLNG